MTVFKPGDVVLGAFVTEDGKILHHYSVVLMANHEGAILVYTTSLKEQCSAKQVFSAEDMRLAGWSKACRWDASNISLVPNTEIRKVGRISKKTLTEISAAHMRAQQQKSVVATVFDINKMYAD